MAETDHSRVLRRRPDVLVQFIVVLLVVMVMLVLSPNHLNQIKQGNHLHPVGIARLEQLGRPRFRRTAHFYKEITGSNGGNVAGCRLVAVALATEWEQHGQLNSVACNLANKIILGKNGSHHVQTVILSSQLAAGGTPKKQGKEQDDTT